MKSSTPMWAQCARPWGILVSLLLALAGGPACARNVALLVAVGRFKSPDVPQLYGTAADIDSMQTSITKRWHFDPKDVVALRDREATHDRILAEISALEKRSAAGDTVFIYFSGHGTSANDQDNAYDLPYATGAWVPYDFDPDAPLRTLIVGRTDLVPRLTQLDKTGRWVVVVSDSCFSGQVVRGLGHTHGRSRYLPLHKRDLGIAPTAAPVTATSQPAPGAAGARPPPPPYPYQHVILISGASDSEEGTDISTGPDLRLWPTLDGQYHGAFTDAFLRLLEGQLLPNTFTYAEGRDAVNSFLEHREFPQHPQLLPAIAEDPQDIGSDTFLSAAVGTGSMGAAAPPAVVSTVANAAVRVRLVTTAPALRAKIAALRGVAIVDTDYELTVSQNGSQVQLLGQADDPILSTTDSDPNLIKRIAAQSWIDRAPPLGGNPLGLRAEADPGSRGNTFVECESFVFEVRLQRPAYIMVLDLDSHGQLTVLYPTGESERQIVGSGAPRAIPGTDPKDHIVASAPFGTDAVLVLAFEQPPDFFKQQNNSDTFAVDSPRANAIAAGLAHVHGAVSRQRIDVHTYPAKNRAHCGL
jgi:hypothetical protein